MSPPAHPRPNQRWAHFQVQSEVARGNMGVVYRARDLRTGKDVALKVLLHHRTDAESVERFQRESKTLARLGHRAIVAIEAWGVHEEIPYLAMEFVPGTNLQELLDAGMLPQSRAIDLLAQVALAIDHAHSRGVIHRDLKPANVLIGSDGAPRITDFGLARLTDASVSVTQEGDLVGTPVFMSPEQIRGEIRALGPSTDVWALGVMMYLLLTGQLPFRGQTVDEVSRRVVQDEPVAPHELIADLPPDLERVCAAALRKDPRLRYQSAGELGSDLLAFLHGRPVLAGRVTWGLRLRRAGRAARLHAGLILAALLFLSLVGGAFLGLRLWAESRRAEQVRALAARGEERREAAARALRGAALALPQDPAAARALGLEAEEELTTAAVLADRAGRVLAGEEAVGAPAAAPGKEEVERALERDPDLAARLLLARAHQARAAVHLPGDPRVAGRPAAELLEASFLAGGDPADLEALAWLAERQNDLELALRARGLLDQGEGEPTPARIQVRARLARLGALEPCSACASRTGEATLEPWRCAYCGHRCAAAQVPCRRCGLSGDLRGRDDEVGAAAREAEALRWMLLGEPQAARRALGASPPGPGPEERLLRAAIARGCGDPEEALALLAPLVEGEARDPRALLERARARLDMGRPRSALADAEEVLRAPTPALEVSHQAAALAALARHLSGGAALEPLRDLVDARSAPFVARLEAARLLLLLDPTPPLVPRPPKTSLATVEAAWARVLGAGQAARAEDTLGALALARLAQARPGDEPELPSELIAAVERWPVAQGRAAVVILLQARIERGPGSGWEKRSRALVEAGGGPLPGLLRIRGEAPPGGLPTDPGESSLMPIGLATGVEALATYLHEGSDEEGRAAHSLALRGLTLAVREAPLDPWPRIQRGRLHLRRAALDPVRADDHCRRALTDAAVAALLDPDEPAAAALLRQAEWVSGSAPAGAAEPGPSPWLPRLGPDAGTPGPALDPAEELALAHLPASPHGPWELGWVDKTEPEHLAALRHLRLLARAGGGAEPGGPEADAGSIGSLLRERMVQTDDPLAKTLLAARLLLEQPEAIDELLLRPALPDAGQAELMTRLREARDPVSGAVARALAQLGRLDGSDREARVREARRELRRAARGRPSPGLLALEAALEVWLGPPSREELADLREPPWPGELSALFRAWVEGTPLPERERARQLAELPQLRRLAGSLAR